MCKLMLIAGLNPKKKKENWEFITTMGELMTPGNNDGIGYTAVKSDGNIFGERWLLNHEGFNQRKDKFTKPRKIDKDKTNALKEMLTEFMDLEEEKEIEPIEKYGNFGTLNPEIVAVTLHTRAASNTVNYANVHPFVDEEKSVSVVHNGIIRNHTKADEIRSTCDSERILNMYLDHEINTIPVDMQNFIDDLKGWMACGIFSKDRDGIRVLDIFKSGAQLSAAYVKELDAMVFSTSLDDIRKACRRLGYTINAKADRVKEDVLIRLNATTGEKILTQKYRDTTKSFNYTSAYESEWSRDTSESYWEKKAKEREEEDKKRKEAIKNVVNEIKKSELALVPDVIDEIRPTESEQQEAAELRRSGVVTETEIKEQHRERRIKAIMERNHTREVAEAYIDKRDAIDEMMKRGWSEEDAREVVEKKLLVGLVSKQEVKTAKDIITKNVTDKLMENMAAMSDYYFMKDSGMWMKRANAKH